MPRRTDPGRAARRRRDDRRGFVLVVRAGPGAATATRAVGDPAPPDRRDDPRRCAVRPRGLAGKPVVINFWGPSCVPCRDEFPLLEAKLAAACGRRPRPWSAS